MANDIDMLNDIDDLEQNDQIQANDLRILYNTRYNDGDIELAELLKDKFYDEYGYWGNWY